LPVCEDFEGIMTTDQVHWLHLRVGECTEHRAFVYALISPIGRFKPGDVVGQVRGPFCVHSSTLPATYPLRFAESVAGPIVSAVITDPCPWSPEQPMLYTAEFTDGELKYDLGGLAIRRFAARGNSLYLNGKRWVIRGIFDWGPVADSATWRQHATVRVVRRLDETLLSEAAKQGVLIIEQLMARKFHGELSHRGRFPALAMALFPEGLAPPADAREQAPNLLLAQRISHPSELGAWAHVAWMEAEAIQQFPNLISTIPVPIIAVRRYRGDSLAAARAAIDTLQADLAPIGQFAGYVV